MKKNFGRTVKLDYSIVPMLNTINLIIALLYVRNCTQKLHAKYLEMKGHDLFIFYSHGIVTFRLGMMAGKMMGAEVAKC